MEWPCPALPGEALPCPALPGERALEQIKYYDNDRTHDNGPYRDISELGQLAQI